MNIIGEYSERTSIALKEVKEEIERKIEESKMAYGYSHILYKNALDNIVESIIFEEYLLMGKERLFEESVFYKLKNTIIEENPGMFPLKDGYSKRKIIKINWFIVPTNSMIKLPEKIQQCPTAMVTNKGDMVFNKDFCEKLCKYAKTKGIKAKGSKYKSNGGEIPDYYEYIEFLIMHEYMHIIHGDVFYIKKFKNINKAIQNIVGDYIINYKLVKEGYNQLPIGLFNEFINYDKYETIEEMREKVESEILKNTNPKQAEKTLEEYSEMLDQHNNTDFEESEKVDNSQELDNSVNSNQSESDKIGKDAQDESLSDPISQENTSQDHKKEGGSESFFEIEEEYVPQYKWNSLIKKLLPANNPKEDYSYTKMSKKTISCLKQLKELGVSSSKPGVVKIDSDKKGIFFIIDNSGSVMKELQYIKKELLNVLKERKSLLSEVYVLKFDNKFKIYKLNIKQNKYYEINQQSSEKSSGPIEEVFKEKFWGGSTIFSKEIVENAIKLWMSEYNVVLFSDSDIIESQENFNNLKILTSTLNRRKNSFAIITTKSSYENYVKLDLNNTLLSSFN